jgi:NTE family protein
MTPGAGGHEIHPNEAIHRAAAPVHLASGDSADPEVEDGIGLCLSGGGYRAMLFHLGTLRRLNELGYLARIARYSSVSGGSITAGALAARWAELHFDAEGRAINFDDLVLERLRGLARVTIDRAAVARGLFSRGSIGDRVAAAYREHLFDAMTLQDLAPDPPNPRFVFNATNLQSGVLWRFSRPYMWDYRVGKVANPQVPLATAVAASSAFPPVLSPVVLNLQADDFVPGSGDSLQKPPYVTRVVLTDGGVYDNLGLETVWKRYRTVLVSDGGGRMEPEERPARLWPAQLQRVVSVIDSQVRSLRKRQTIEGFVGKIREGTYWGIGTDILHYQLKSALPCPKKQTDALAAIPTRLAKLDDVQQERLINWGYAVCDAAMRTHVERAAPAPPDFPFPGSGVG